jgi:curved DNA-binding protein CbpA
MNDVLEAIEQNLGRRLVGDSFNHYSLLGITPRADAEEIRRAIRETVKLWNAASSKTNPMVIPKVTQLLKQAQTTLLDEHKRTIYDAALLGTLSTKRPLKNSPACPSDDPLAPFEPASFRVLRGEPLPSAEERWQELIRRMGVPAPAPKINLAPVEPYSDGVSERQSSRESLANQRIIQIRKKRKRQELIWVGGFLFLAASILGLAAYNYFKSPKKIVDSSRNERNRNLIDSRDLRNQDSPASTEDNEKLVAGEEVKSPALEMPELPALASEQKAAPPPTDASTKEPIPSTPMTVQAPSSEPTPVADPKAWALAMRSAKDSLYKNDLDSFGKSMEEAIKVASTPEQMDQQKRLDQLGQLYKIARDALQQSKSKMRGADSLQIGKNRVSIVEVRDDVIIVRTSGTNQSYAWGSLPMGLALALCDLVLSDNEPTDLAARAVYLALSPNRNDLYDAKIAELFERSVGKGKIRKDLAQALTDTYE